MAGDLLMGAVNGSRAPILPILSWLPAYERDDLRRDLVAGLTVAVLMIPQALAYAAMAGLPPVTGLYTAIGALVLYAVFGTSPYVSAGPTALTALLVASTVMPLAGGDPQRYLLLAGTLALLVGIVRVVLGLVRAGAVMDLVSQPVLTGFTAGAAAIIMLSQAGALLGTDLRVGDEAVTVIRDLLANLGDVSVLALPIGLAALVLLFASNRMTHRFPAALVVILALALSVWLFDLGAVGLPLVDDVPVGLPTPSVPVVGAEVIAPLLRGAVVIALVGYLEGVSVAKAIALRSRERIDVDQELIANGAASIGAALLGGFASGGSFSRTALNHRAGARTALSSIASAAIIVLSLVLLTPLFSFIPEVALAAIVIYAAAGLFDLQGMKRAWRMRRRDGVALVVTLVATLTLGVEAGFLIGAGLNVLLYLHRVSHPYIRELGRVRGTGTYRNVNRWEVETAPEVAVLRLDAPLIFLSVKAFTDRVNRLLAERPELSGFVLDASGIGEIDASGMYALQMLLEESERGGWDLRFATLRGPVRDTIERAGLWELVRERAYPDVASALASMDCSPSRIVSPAPGELAPGRIL